MSTRAAPFGGWRSPWLLGALGCTGLTLFLGCANEWQGPLPGVAPHEEQSLAIDSEPPPLSEETFPCTDCHDPDIPYNPKRRVLTQAHEDIVLHHDEENRWCLDCHSGDHRDQLHLANGTLVEFTESYRLCGQCHGDRYRDWKRGEHGRRSGDWDGHKKYLLCVSCHDSHQPHFKPIQPLPPPDAPKVTR